MSLKATSIHEYFRELTDPRSNSYTRHLLMDILVIALCATIGGAEGFNDIELYGRMKETWFRTFLDLPNGIPSHDTFNRVFSLLSPEEFSKCFIKWTQSLAKKLEGVVAIDGKTLRRSFLSASKTTALHMVSAWSSENKLVLGQIRTAAKSNEITAIPELISMLDIKGCTVTIDAMGCQKDIAQKIIDNDADYVLGLKGNQGNTLDAAEFLFKCEEKDNFRGVFHTEYDTPRKNHSRIEKREIYSIGIPNDIKEFAEWPGLKSITMVVSTRQITGKEPTIERRFYLSSLPARAEQIGNAIRAHWGIENSLHWILDVDFREDYARNRKNHSAENMAILRHIVVNLVKKENSSKTSFRGKLLKASWSDDYVLKLLSLN
ncbi:ISAs1 family transposase [Synergistales bacterium]|nr:ISAs1 family transposase [Synergistales bacterium]